AEDRRLHARSVLRRLGRTPIEELHGRILLYCHQAVEGLRKREALPRRSEQHRAQATPGIRDRLRQAAGEDPVELQLGPFGAVEPIAVRRRRREGHLMRGLPDRHLLPTFYLMVSFRWLSSGACLTIVIL